jgi:3-deoxy-D-manno-octulosonate 8-phosphate phosphatase (KDO 8-P phosphatase)
MTQHPDGNGAPLQQKLAAVRLLAMDVDGVLTDGGILLSGPADEQKRFHVQDGLGIQLAQNGGLVIAWISGRRSTIVERRARELGVEHLYQGVTNKAAPMAELLGLYTLKPDNIAYIGDDWNDLPAFHIAGVKCAPANAMPEIKGIADLITDRPGGGGAVREICDVILKAQGRWNDAVQQYLARLVQPQEAGPADESVT